MAAAIDNMRVAGGGVFTERCQKLLEGEIGVKKAFLTTSCTSALEMAALLLNVQAGDEVIVPSFSFVSTANAFAMRGAKPIFADIRPDTLNLDEAKLARHITKKTKAIVVMHYAGVGCEMDAIVDLARQHSIAVVEDNAHGLFGKYKDKFLGTFGCMATQSFHETKNFTCGEGGALLLNDADLIPRAELSGKKGRTARGSSVARWKNIPGLILVRAICCLIYWRPFSWRSSKLGSKSKAGENGFGNSTRSVFTLGRKVATLACLPCRTTSSILITSFI
jgi:dTDP-4-amino-4,6-dideoxygalactose transaminase